MLAIGIVVDDAIVIVEGAAHHIERGLSAHNAAVKAMDELFGPVIGITLVLMAVFIPAAFLPGLSGKMFAQFALVIAATALISAVNAGTLKPTQCALWLRPAVPPAQRNRFYRGFNVVYGVVERGYGALIGRMTRYSGTLVLLGLVLGGVGVWGVARLPTAFIPIEDQGLFRRLRAIAQRRLAGAHPPVARGGQHYRAHRRWRRSGGGDFRHFRAGQ